MTLNIAILDDNKTDSRRLKELLSNWTLLHPNTIFYLFFYSDPYIFLAEYAEKKLDVCFFDIQFSDKKNIPNGIDIAKQLRENNFRGEIIFLTSFQEYALNGYDVNAFQYLIKPVSSEKLNATLSALEEKYSDQYYTLNTKKMVFQILYRNIITITSSNHDSIITTIDDVYSTRTPLRDIARILPSYFVQCHRSCIVNLYQIIHIDYTTIILKNNTHQSIGQTYLKNLQEKYAEIIFKRSI